MHVLLRFFYNIHVGFPYYIKYLNIYILKIKYGQVYNHDKFKSWVDSRTSLEVISHFLKNAQQNTWIVLLISNSCISCRPSYQFLFWRLEPPDHKFPYWRDYPQTSALVLSPVFSTDTKPQQNIKNESEKSIMSLHEQYNLSIVFEFWMLDKYSYRENVAFNLHINFLNIIGMKWTSVYVHRAVSLWTQSSFLTKHCSLRYNGYGWSITIT